MASSKTEITLGLDINSSSVRLIQLEHSENEVKLLKVGIKPLEQDDNKNNVIEAINNLLETCEIKTSDVIIHFDSSQTIIKKILIDPEEKDIIDYLLWETEQQLLDSPDKYFLDYYLLPDKTKENNDSNCFIVAVRKNDINKRTDLVKTAKLNPLVLDLDIFAILNSFEKNYRELSANHVVLVNIENNLTNIIFVNKNAYSSHSYLTTPPNITINVPNSENQDVNAFTSEISRLIKENIPLNENKKIDAILLSGEGAVNPEIRNNLLSKIDTDIKIADPFKEIIVDKAINSKEDFKKIVPTCMVALGLALRKPKEEVYDKD